MHFFVCSLNFYWQSCPLSHDTAKLSIPECVQEFLQRLSAAVCFPLRFKFKCKQLLQCASKQTSKKKNPGGRGVLNIHDHVVSNLNASNYILQCASKHASKKPMRFKFKCKQLLQCASKVCKQTGKKKKKKTWRSRSSKHTRSRRLKPTPLSFSLLLPQQLSSLFSPSPTPRRLFIVRCKI